MGERIVVPAWPTVPECMSWSDDSDIAIAAVEVVELLIPKLSIALSKQESEDAQWARVRVQVNLFDEAELPFFEPLGFETFSVGEEQSQGTVKSLAWSPAGLAKYRRCALAVLGTNHVLSLWASDSNLKEHRSWSRVLIINNALQQFAREDQSAASTHDSLTRDQMIRLRCRVRAFEWCPKPPCVTLARTVSQTAPTQPSDLHYLAITNDLHEIIILKISSPHANSVFTSVGWAAHVCDSFSLQHPGYADDLSTLSLPGITPLCSFVDQITWSKWIKTTGDKMTILSSVLAFTLKGDLKLRRCSLVLGEGALKLKLDQDDIKIAGEHAGLVKWVPTVGLIQMGNLGFADHSKPVDLA